MSELENTVQTSENMNVCNQCGAEVKASARFCPSCGRPMNVAVTKKFCARCGIELSGQEMFCHNCGSPTSQSRDADAMSNIAAYNNSVVKPKKSAKIVNIKDNSVWSFIAWTLTALFAALFSIYLIFEISRIIIMGSFALLSIWSLLVLGWMGFVAATVSGILFWKNDKKLRILPVIASLVATLCELIELIVHYGIKIELLVSGLLMHIVAILFAVKVIKTKKVLLITSISAMTLTFLLGWFRFNYMYMLFHKEILFVLQIPMFLLTFSFTTKELKETPKKKQVLRRLLAFGVAALLIFGGIGKGVYQNWVYVGDVTNMDFNEAARKYSRLDVIGHYEYSDTVEKGKVIKQSIDKGKVVYHHVPLFLTVSKGAGVKVPDITNLTFDEAKMKLEALGLKASVVYDYSSSIEKDRVMRASSYHVDEGSTVTLTLSKGPDNRVYVPDVKNSTESGARKKLEQAGFKVKVEYLYQTCDAYSDTSWVESQSLTDKQEPGSIVTIYVIKPSISITKVNFDHNYVGGVDVDIRFKNLSGKNIKYVRFTARFKNSVGDNVYCDIYKSSTRVLEYTGPLYSGRSDTAYWDAAIYNWNCSRICFDEIEVTFMDGTTHTMTYNGYWYR